MTPPGQWLRPPRTLLLALFLLTLIAVSALGWFGHRLLDQERMVEAQRARERQEQAADRIAAITREALAETGERLGSWALNPPSDGRPAEGVLLVVAGKTISVTPRGRLLYGPEPSEASFATETASDLFSEGEALEFQQGRPEQAFDIYKRLADSKDTAIRAGALVRMGRVLRRMGRIDEAQAVYENLATIGTARVAGVPANLVARLALSGGEALQRDLLAGKWSLSRGQFEFYWSEASRQSGRTMPIPTEPAALSAVVADGWRDLIRDGSERGQKVDWINGSPFLLIWRGGPERRAVLATRPESIFRQVLPRGDLSFALVDADGRTLFGQKSQISLASVRTPAETQLPWTLYITAGTGDFEGGMIARQRFLLMITALTALILIAGAYFIARAIRTEAAVARVQSDFVSAVSHEFRSPLTSMRQLSEILALGRITSEERRQIYYETLVRETVRLQRLVEGLLSFGRMEAGVRRFRFEEMDAARLIAGVAAEFEPQIAGAGRHIEVAGTDGACTIHADPEALTVALRNLVDNALKYAPDCPTIRMECEVEDDLVAIRVRDRGPGIPLSERRAIFRKFVRGSAAVSTNVKGSGLGLAMVRHIVAVHRGRIRVTSEAGAGSTFTILLPRGAGAA